MDSVRISRQDTTKSRINRHDACHDAKLLAVDFEGSLQVVDAELLKETLRRGVGSGKGFGFGLLSLAPA